MMLALVLVFSVLTFQVKAASITLDNVYLLHGVTQNTAIFKRYLASDIIELLEDTSSTNYKRFKRNIEESLKAALINQTTVANGLNVTSVKLKDFRIMEMKVYSISEITIDHQLVTTNESVIIKTIFEKLLMFFNEKSTIISNSPTFFSEIQKNQLVVISDNECFKFEKTRCACYLEMLNLTICPTVVKTASTSVQLETPITSIAATSEIKTLIRATSGITTSIRATSSITTSIRATSSITTSIRATSEITESVRATSEMDSLITSTKVLPTTSISGTPSLTSKINTTMRALVPILPDRLSTTTTTLPASSSVVVVIGPPGEPSPTKMPSTNKSTKDDDDDSLLIGLIIGGVFAVLLVLLCAILICRYYDKHERFMYPIERKERLSNIKKEMQYGMMISSEADIIQIEDGDGGGGGGGFGQPFTSFQPYTGHFSVFPGKGKNIRDSGISLLDVLDERDHGVGPSGGQDLQGDDSFNREGTVHNPVYLDEEVGDNGGDDGAGEGPNQGEEDDFRNIFDDNFYKTKPDTLKDYAKQFNGNQEENKQPDTDDDVNDGAGADDKKNDDDSEISSSSGDEAPLEETAGAVDDPHFYHTIPRNKDDPQLYDTIPRKKGLTTAGDGVDNGDPTIPNLYETIPKQKNVVGINEEEEPLGDHESSPPPPVAVTKDEVPDDEPPKKEPPPPRFLRTGSVAKLVSAFTNGDLNREPVEVHETEKKNLTDEDEKKTHAYRNPLYQDEKKILAYSNSGFENDKEDEEKREPVDKPNGDSQNTDEQLYLKPVDETPKKTGSPSRPTRAPPPAPPIAKKRTSTVKKAEPPPVAPKRGSLKNNKKTLLDRSLSVQQPPITKRPPAPPPRIPSMKK